VAIIFLVVPVGIIITLGVGKIDSGSENVGAGVDGGGISAMNELAGRNSSTHNQDDTVDQSGKNAAVRKIQERRRIQHNELIFLGSLADKHGHVLGREQVRRVGRHGSAGQDKEANRRCLGQKATPIRTSGQEVYEARGVGNSEKLVKAWPAQIGIDEEHFFP
jgi:hypothetical protein